MEVKKLITLILVVGTFLTACGGGEIPWVDLPPTEEGAEESIATLVPATVEPTAEIVQPTTEPSPVSGPPPIIQLTAVYSIGESFTVPIWCPVPEEYCNTGVEIFDEDGDYLGLGFSLPAGTPIFALIGSEFLETDRWDNSKIDKYAYFLEYEFSPHPRRSFWPDYYLVQARLQHSCYVSFWYNYSGVSTFFESEPEPEKSNFFADGGQVIGRVNNPDSSLLRRCPYFWDLNGADGQEIHGVNFILVVRHWHPKRGAGTCGERRLRIYFDRIGASTNPDRDLCKSRVAAWVKEKLSEG